jgi:hypothetical protein
VVFFLCWGRLRTHMMTLKILTGRKK